MHAQRSERERVNPLNHRITPEPWNVNTFCPLSSCHAARITRGCGWLIVTWLLPEVGYNITLHGHVSCTLLLLPRCYVPVVVVYLSMCMCLCLAFECFRDNKLWCNPLLLMFISRTLSPVVIIILTLHTLHLISTASHSTEHRHTHGLITTAAEREQSQY